MTVSEDDRRPDHDISFGWATLRDVVGVRQHERVPLAGFFGVRFRDGSGAATPSVDPDADGIPEPSTT